MNNSYDIIIIGSGMGGLASAVLLAKEGFKVCVLEKNNQYGGNLQTFVRDKTILDTGVHYIGGLAEQQNLHRFFSYLGILEDLKLEQMDKDGFDFITFDNDSNAYPYAQGYDNFIHQLSSFFPEEKEIIEKFCAKIQEVCTKFPLYNLGTETVYDTEILSLNLKDYLDSLTSNEKLKAVLVGSNLLYAGNGETTPFYVHALSVNSYISSAWKCLRGGSQISKALIKQLRKFGGDVFKRTEIQKFIYEDEKLVGVQSSTGKKYYAKQFISNIDLNRTIELAGDQIFKKSFRNRVNNLEETPSSFTLHIVFKPKSFPYFNYNIYHFKKEEYVWNGNSEKEGIWPKTYMISMGASHKNQEFAENMSVLTYMSFEKVKKWENTVNTIVNENDRGEEYEKFKQKHIQLLLDEVERKFPEIRSHILNVYATTPLTYRDYIGGRNGNMYGFVKDSGNPLKTYFSPKTKIENLFLTGQNVNMHGIMGVTIGAVNTCSEIVGREYLVQKIRNETKKS